MTIQEDTLQALETEMRIGERIILTGDFTCREINSEDFETEGGEDTWEIKLLKLATNNLMAQWVKGKSRVRGKILHQSKLVLTKGLQLKGKVSHECPPRKGRP